MNKDNLYRYICSGGVRVMGVLNLTPDSFFDGGAYPDADTAVKRAQEMARQGADIIDVGAESTRPGAGSVSKDEEILRLEPVLQSIKKKLDIPVSLDTSKHEVAREFLERGYVDMINDVSGLERQEMAELLRKHDVPAVIMHMYGKPGNMQDTYEYEDVVVDIKNFFIERLSQTGLEKIILDPGIGFGKSVGHNLEIIRRLKEFYSLGYPLMIGVSRKSFIGKILNLDPCERLEGSLGALAMAVVNGAKIARVHDVKETVRMIKVIEAIENAAYKEIQV